MAVNTRDLPNTWNYLQFVPWKHGEPMNNKVKQIIINTMIRYQECNPEKSVEDLDEDCSFLIGIGKRTLGRLRTEVKKTGKISTSGIHYIINVR